MKFIVDSMLGRLAKWLRLLGHDTLYYPDIEDGPLLRIAREEDRILLTRDTRLVKVRDISSFLLLEENNPFAQLKKVITTFRLSSFRGGCTPSMHSRCSLCNTILIEIPKEEAKEYVPEYVYNTTSIFKKCPTCVKFYWKGTHQEKIIKQLSDILE